MNERDKPSAFEAAVQKTSLHEALARAGAAARAVEKDSRNDFHRYRYASAEAIYAEARSALHDNGLSLIPTKVELEPNGEGAWRARLGYLLVHSGGDAMPLERTWPVVPDKGRPLDKALASALTTALAYLCRDLLLLPRVEEGAEVDQREDRERHEPPARPAPKRAPKADLAPAAALADAERAKGLRAEFAPILEQLPPAQRDMFARAAAQAGNDCERLAKGLAAAKAALGGPS